MSNNGSYVEVNCATCMLTHWIPSGLWETCVATRNDKQPRSAYCPYGHPYQALADKNNTGVKPPPPELKKPRRFLDMLIKPKNGDNVVPFRKD